MIYKRWRGMFAVLLSVLAGARAFPMHPQTTTNQQSAKNNPGPSSAKWIENKVLVRVDTPYLSDSGSLVLAYTLTNKSGKDIQLDFTDDRPISLEQREPTRVFLKLKNPDNYTQVTPKDHFLYLSNTLLVANLPVSFHVFVSLSSEDKPSWFSSESTEDRLRRLLQKKLGNTDSIAIFIPDRQLKISLPIPSKAIK